MYGFLLTLLVLDGIFLTVVILLQAGKGGGLAAMGGGVTATEGVLGGRQATTFLTRATWTAGTVFMVLSLVLAILSSRGSQPASILQQDGQPAGAPTPVLPQGDAPQAPDAGAPDAVPETEPTP
ncbi:MAG: preprotein translocase subunit SecG [Gemmatimonadota bacterium]